MKIALTLSALALSVMPAMAYSGCSGDKVKAWTRLMKGLKDCLELALCMKSPSIARKKASTEI